MELSGDTKKPGSKSLDLSLKAQSGVLADKLPANLRDVDDLRKLDLSGQTKLGKDLTSLRFVGETLTWLNMSGVDCTQVTIWLWASMMRTLFVLNVSHCNLEALPKELNSISSLKALVASHNQLTSPSLAHLASLSSLNSLILSDNQLTSLPSSITTLISLKKWSLANNKLRSDTIPDLSPLRSLEELRLNGNPGISTVPVGLTNLPVLSLLELSGTSMKSWTEVEQLKSCPKLVNLGLKGTPLASEPDYREKVISILPNLRILDNIRFDPKFLQRKEKLKAKRAEQAGEVLPEQSGKAQSSLQAAAVPTRQAKVIGGNDQSKEEVKDKSLSEVQRGKRKAEQQDNSSAIASAKSVKKRKNAPEQVAPAPIIDPEVIVFSEDEEVQPANVPSAVPKKKRSRVRKRLEREAALSAVGEAVAEEQPKKRAKQVGGSLSAPVTQADAGETHVAKEEVAEDLLKARSSVVGVVDAKKATRKAGNSRSARIHEDLLAVLLQGQTQSDSAPKGWD